MLLSGGWQHEQEIFSTNGFPLEIMGGGAFAVFFLVWWGIPASNKWQADKLVDGLCAKDGGIKVYETVKLSPERFSEFGEILIPLKKDAKSTDEYFFTSETTWIIPEGNQVRDLDLRRDHDKLFRAQDGRLLAESVGYSRRGGDPASPAHPSYYACPQHAGVKYMNQKVFIHKGEIAK